MCGIGGFQGRFSQQLLAAMTTAINHRGPDASGTQYFKHQDALATGLAHTRLSIIDLSSAGSQPMTVTCPCCQPANSQSESDQLWLTYNGEIYNYRELKSSLTQQGHQFTTATDSEVILHLYAQHGLAAIEKLEGIFSFAIYDGRRSGQQDGVAQGDLIAVRDGVGVKPFYYATTKQGFLFSSELKALLCDESLSREIDLQAMDQYLNYLWSPGERTMLQSVKKLLPGHAMLIRQGAVREQWQYYDIPVQVGKTSASFDEAADSLREKLSLAVEKQMVSDVPVGAFLSGGLDSSSIVALMRQQNPELPIDCFTIRRFGKDHGFADDLPYAQAVAKDLDVNLHVVDAKPEMISRLPEMLYHLDEPQADPAAINVLLITELAKQQGVKVLMSGAGGDDLFTGYRRHYALQMSRYWGWLPHGLRRVVGKASRAWLSGKGIGMKHPVVRRALKLLRDCDRADDAYIASFFSWCDARQRQNLYSSEVASNLTVNDDNVDLMSQLNGMSEVSPLSKMLYLELKHFLVDHNLNYTDKMSMANGVEVRVPLLDSMLIKFAFTLPDHYKQQGKLGKAVFKRAMEPLLSKQIIYRPKSGFGAPLRGWLHHELSDKIQDTFTSQTFKSRGLFNPEKVRRLVELDKQGKAEAAYTIFSLFCTELWCQQFIDGKVPAPISL